MKMRNLLIFSGLCAAVACGDSRVKAVDTGITEDSLMSVLAKGATRQSDPMPNVYRKEQYLIAGKMWDIFYFHGDSARLSAQTKDTIPWKDLTPIVVIDNKVMGKGWDYWDSVSKANKIPVKDHGGAKADTTKKKS